MEIIKGGLDAISRPASGEQTGSRVGPAAPWELLVLSNDSADVQQNCRGEMEHRGGASEAGKDQSEIADEQNEDSKLQQAFEEMRRLDEILSAEIFKEKEIRRQRKELQAKLWKELQRKPDRYPECAQEALNTKLFLALEAPPCKEAEDWFAPLFETQVPDCEHDGRDQGLDQTEKQPDSLTESFKGSSASIGGFQFVKSNSKTPKTKNKERDFVQRNIELVSSEVGEMPLTHAEKARLAELLQEINEEEKGSASGTDSKEAMWATSASAGQGYTPEPSDLEQLMEIDSKIRLLLPAAEFHSLESSYTDLSVSQGPGSKVGWKHDGDRQPGEKVLQDIKERRELERRLQQIQQQLEILGGGQEMTNESADLIEEQLLCLLGECERTKSWSRDNQRNGTVPSEP
ncbi:fibrous sheath-interacting protein 1 isoform X1 [Fundulus heteroclitus]|uniref:fibrous sheath-interacting protein 1 isoform X1 n=1 Tax=Fundulus heteroclitus TaxID=8078 RepID=UPI00165ADA7D|nr:fibrous sheath-interacting protein 1 isoform X1 [Fundulus heteroclitus]